MVLIPILKDPMTSSTRIVDSPNSARVKFDLATERESIVQYYLEDGQESRAFKLNSIIKTILSKDTEVNVIFKIIKFYLKLMFSLINNCNFITSKSHYAFLKYNYVS